MRPLLTPLGLLTGKVAIRFAEEHGLRLNKYADSLSPARNGLSPDQARKLNPELVWIELK